MSSAITRTGVLWIYSLLRSYSKWIAYCYRLYRCYSSVKEISEGVTQGFAMNVPCSGGCFKQHP